jgi:hypothetical protein
MKITRTPVAVTGLLALGIGAVSVMSGIGQSSPSVLMAGQDTPLSATVTDQVNVRPVPVGQAPVDLSDNAVVGKLAAGSQVQIVCQFTSTTAGAAGNTWYRITGGAVPMPTAVASAAYLRLTTPDVTVPPCGGTPRRTTCDLIIQDPAIAEAAYRSLAAMNAATDVSQRVADLIARNGGKPLTAQQISDFIAAGTLTPADIFPLLAQLNHGVHYLQCQLLDEPYNNPISPADPGQSGKKPPLKQLHSDSTLSGSSLDYWRKQSTEDIVRSLAPDSEIPLTVKEDGTVMNGNTRIKALRERGYDVDSLPRTPYASPWSDYFDLP